MFYLPFFGPTDIEVINLNRDPGASRQRSFIGQEFYSRFDASVFFLFGLSSHRRK